MNQQLNPNSVSELQAVLRELVKHHQMLLECLQAKKQALAKADLEAVGRLCNREHAVTQRVRELEERRLQLVSSVAQRMPGNDNPSLQQISEAVPEEQGKQLTALRDQLQHLIETVRRESSVARTAAEALSQHLSGILQSVHAAISQAGVYGRRGVMTQSAGAAALDVKS